MIIYNRDGTILADVWLQESSFVNEEIMGDHSAQIDFLSRYPIDLEIGDYIEHEGNIYTLRHNESVTKRETSLGWDYSVMLYAAQYELQDVPFFLSDQPQYLKNGDYYTGTASDWLQLIIRNMNREISGWAAGSCVESEWITISFKDKQCSEVLDELCAQLDTEWQVIGRTLSIGRVEYPSDGLVLSQGEGGGLKELRLSSSNQERPVTVLYPYGEDKNLPEGYGSDYLLLPGGQKVMERNVDKYGRCGMKVQFEVYPKGEFTVTSIVDDLTFTADGIDFDLAACLIPDTEVTVSFQSGALAGYDLAIAEDGWDNATKRIKVLQIEEENALKVPGDLCISVGDRFTLFNLRMPVAYVSKAEEELKAKAEAWLAKQSEKEVSLSAKCDDILFKQNDISIRCGQMVRILSLELDLDKEIRVTKVKRYIENEIPTYRYELTLSDFLDINGFKQLVKDVENVPEEIKTETKPFKAWTRRSWRDVMETLSMMFDPEGDYFTELIKPLAVHTAQLIVGTNSQQMDLVGVRFIPNKGGDPNIFASTVGKLEHFTISEEGVREWNIAASEYTLNPNTPYYVYAKCPRTGAEGTIICSTDKIKLEDDADYYHFWVGVLNSPYEGSRSWNPNYGYTEIAGETITTGTIKDKTGNSYFDLTNNKFRIGGQQGSLDWNVTKEDQLTLRGCLYQSPAGDVDYPEVDRGDYSGTIVYYPGDKVSYEGNVYKCIKQTTAGIAPTNETYWKVLVSKGADGSPGSPGAPGAQGLQGPATPFRGLYDSEKIYYCNEDRTDIVYILDSKGNKIFYIARTDAPAIDMKGKHPVDYPNFWKQFGAQFESVATDLLLSRKILAGEIDTSKLTVYGAQNIGNFTWESSSSILSGSGRIVINGGSAGGQVIVGDNFNYNRWANLYADKVNIGEVWFNGYVHFLSDIRDGCLVLASEGSLAIKIGGEGEKGNGIWGMKGSSTIGNLYLNSGAPSTAFVKITNWDQTSASDIRIKNIFYDVPNVLDKLEGISAFYYTFKEDEDKILKIGVSAQAVKEVFPEAVTLITPDNADSYYGVNYIQLLTAVGINGLKELHAKVKALEERVKALEG